MIITTARLDEGTRAFVDGDKLKAVHVEEVSALLKHNSEQRKDGANGFTRLRHFRMVAQLSPLAYMEAVRKYPEIRANDPKVRQKAWRKALADEKFAPYKTVAKGL